MLLHGIATFTGIHAAQFSLCPVSCHMLMHVVPPVPPQVVQFFSDHLLDLVRFPYRLNSLLPMDVRAVDMHATAPDFSVTISALTKVRTCLLFHIVVPRARPQWLDLAILSITVLAPNQVGLPRPSTSCTHDLSDLS